MNIGPTPMQEEVEERRSRRLHLRIRDTLSSMKPEGWRQASSPTTATMQGLTRGLEVCCVGLP